jgi:hypothetical protein
MCPLFHLSRCVEGVETCQHYEDYRARHKNDKVKNEQIATEEKGSGVELF